MSPWLWVLLVGALAWVLAHRIYVRRPSQNNSPVLSPDVDPNEFARVFAKALVDPRACKLLVPLLRISGNVVTSREMAIFQYLLGEADRAHLIKVISATPAREVTYREGKIIKDQMELLASVLATSERSDKETAGP